MRPCGSGADHVVFHLRQDVRGRPRGQHLVNDAGNSMGVVSDCTTGRLHATASTNADPTPMIDLGGCVTVTLQRKE